MNDNVKCRNSYGLNIFSMEINWEMMAQTKRVLKEIAVLAKEIAKNENEHSFVYPQKQMFNLIEELCICYINEQSDVRELIRNFVQKIEGGVSLPGLMYIVPSAIYNFIKSVATKIRKKDDGAFLELGLAAASIEEGKMDSRDFYVALSQLYRAALDEGLDTVQYFNSMIEKSGNEGSKVLANFINSLN